MAVEPKKSEVEEIRELFKGMHKKLDKVCTGIECLPEVQKFVKELPNIAKKIDGIKIPEAPAKPKKHNVFSWMNYCPECGEKVREKPPEYECSDCHVPVDPKKDKVCWNCGSKKAKKKELKLK